MTTPSPQRKIRVQAGGACVPDGGVLRGVLEESRERASEMKPFVSSRPGTGPSFPRLAGGLQESLADTGSSRLAAAGSVEVRGISKAFGEVAAVREASFIVPSGSFVTLLGPSGSGKTTILKVIAGFEEPTSGTVLLAGKDVTHLPAHRRNIGFVFQQYALFPHLTVGGNVAYSLKMRRLPRREIRQRVAEALELTRLSGLQDRYPAQLSGGQQQRVAVARAIVFRPPVLLMDEPLSALDKRLREEMQYEMLGLQRKLGITTIAVTHDQSEALIMSDVIVVLNNGVIEQIGPSDAVYQKPNSEFVANFLGESNILRGIVRHDGAKAYLDLGEWLRVPLAPAATVCEGSRATYILRPEAIRLGRSEGPDAAEIRGRIIERTYCGDMLRMKVDVGPGTQLAMKLLSSCDHPAPEPGSEVHVSWSLHDVTTIPLDTKP